MERLGYYNDDLLVQHEAETKRRHKLRDEVLEKWKLDAKTIKDDSEDMLQKEARSNSPNRKLSPHRRRIRQSNNLVGLLGQNRKLAACQSRTAKNGTLNRWRILQKRCNNSFSYKT